VQVGMGEDLWWISRTMETVDRGATTASGGNNKQGTQKPRYSAWLLPPRCKDLGLGGGPRRRPVDVETDQGGSEGLDGRYHGDEAVVGTLWMK
jgi:hypothetical protein